MTLTTLKLKFKLSTKFIVLIIRSINELGELDGKDIEQFTAFSFNFSEKIKLTEILEQNDLLKKTMFTAKEHGFISVFPSQADVLMNHLINFNFGDYENEKREFCALIDNELSRLRMLLMSRQKPEFKKLN